jgi:hypothetical protein
MRGMYMKGDKTNILTDTVLYWCDECHKMYCLVPKEMEVTKFEGELEREDPVLLFLDKIELRDMEQPNKFLCFTDRKTVRLKHVRDMREFYKETLLTLKWITG